MWKNEPVGFKNLEPVECAYLSQLDMKEWADGMSKYVTVECVGELAMGITKWGWVVKTAEPLVYQTSSCKTVSWV